MPILYKAIRRIIDKVFDDVADGQTIISNITDPEMGVKSHGHKIDNVGYWHLMKDKLAPVANVKLKDLSGADQRKVLRLETDKTVKEETVAISDIDNDTSFTGVTLEDVLTNLSFQSTFKLLTPSAEAENLVTFTGEVGSFSENIGRIIAYTAGYDKTTEGLEIVWNGSAPVTVLNNDENSIKVGQIKKGQNVELYFDSSNFRLIGKVDPIKGGAFFDDVGFGKAPDGNWLEHDVEIQQNRMGEYTAIQSARSGQFLDVISQGVIEKGKTPLEIESSSMAIKYTAGTDEAFSDIYTDGLDKIFRTNDGRIAVVGIKGGVDGVFLFSSSLLLIGFYPLETDYKLMFYNKTTDKFFLMQQNTASHIPKITSDFITYEYFDSIALNGVSACEGVGGKYVVASYFGIGATAHFYYTTGVATPWTDGTTIPAPGFGSYMSEIAYDVIRSIYTVAVIYDLSGDTGKVAIYESLFNMLSGFTLVSGVAPVLLGGKDFCKISFYTDDLLNRHTVASNWTVGISGDYSFQVRGVGGVWESAWSRVDTDTKPLQTFAQYGISDLLGLGFRNDGRGFLKSSDGLTWASSGSTYTGNFPQAMIFDNLGNGYSSTYDEASDEYYIELLDVVKSIATGDGTPVKFEISSGSVNVLVSNEEHLEGDEDVIMSEVFSVGRDTVQLLQSSNGIDPSLAKVDSIIKDSKNNAILTFKHASNGLSFLAMTGNMVVVNTWEKLKAECARLVDDVNSFKTIFVSEYIDSGTDVIVYVYGNINIYGCSMDCRELEFKKLIDDGSTPMVSVYNESLICDGLTVSPNNPSDNEGIEFRVKILGCRDSADFTLVKNLGCSIAICQLRNQSILINGSPITLGSIFHSDWIDGVDVFSERGGSKAYNSFIPTLAVGTGYYTFKYNTCEFISNEDQIYTCIGCYPANTTGSSFIATKTRAYFTWQETTGGSYRKYYLSSAVVGNAYARASFTETIL